MMRKMDPESPMVEHGIKEHEGEELCFEIEGKLRKNDDDDYDRKKYKDTHCIQGEAVINLVSNNSVICSGESLGKAADNNVSYKLKGKNKIQNITSRRKCKIISAQTNKINIYFQKNRNSIEGQLCHSDGINQMKGKLIEGRMSCHGEGYKSQQLTISTTDVSNSDNSNRKVNIPEEVESQGPNFGSPGLLRKARY